MSSENFTFWLEYFVMFGLLLKFLSAGRNGDWQLYLETFEQMLFYDRAYDHLKCFK